MEVYLAVTNTQIGYRFLFLFSSIASFIYNWILSSASLGRYNLQELVNTMQHLIVSLCTAKLVLS